MLAIKGLQKTSLIDYPGKVSCVVFVGGCNFRCPYCHNPDLVEKNSLPDLEEEEILGFLEKRKKWLDAVVISGGEPTLYPELIALVRKVKELGYLVKIDTNGTNPRLLNELMEIVDYVAMDIKASREGYEKVTKATVAIEKIEESVDILKNSSITYEFRTTVVPGLFDDKEAERIGDWLEGANLYVLQQFNPKKDMVDNSFKDVKPFEKAELERFKKIVEKHIRKVDVR